jgi:anti-sigma B factor antagonist
MSGDIQKIDGALRTSVEGHAGVPVLVIAGELDLATAGDVREAIRSTFLDTGNRIVLDMSQVTFIDSTGIRTVLEAQKAADATLVLVAPSAPVTRILDLTRLRRRFVEVATGADAAGLPDA